MYAAVAKSVIGIRNFLTELTYHLGNPKKTGIKPDRTFVQNFSENPDKYLSEAKAKLKEQFIRIFFLLRFFPENRKITKRMTKIYKTILPYQEFYCPTCKSKNQDPAILELYFPDDMDREIIQRNKKRADWYKSLKYKITQYCLSPDLFQLSKLTDGPWEMASQIYGTPKTIRLVEDNPTHKENAD